jgi:hypothetical protein
MNYGHFGLHTKILPRVTDVGDGLQVWWVAVNFSISSVGQVTRDGPPTSVSVGAKKQIHWFVNRLMRRGGQNCIMRRFTMLLE